MPQPAIFFGHGSPMNALGGPFADTWRALGEAVGKIYVERHFSAETKARADADQVVSKAREQIQREKDQAIAELRAQVADIAVEAASRIVKSSLTDEAQRKLVDDYIKELPRAQREGRA